MKIVVLSVLCSFGALVFASVALGQTISVGTSYELDGSVHSSGPGLGESNSFSNSGGNAGGTSSYSNSVSVDYAPQGTTATSSGFVSATANFGSVGVAFYGSPTAANSLLAGPNQFYSASAIVETSGVSAQWTDFVTFDAPGLMPGTIISLGGTLTLSGSFNESFSGGPFNDYRSAEGQFYLTLTGTGGLQNTGGLPSSGPYGGNYYGVYAADTVSGVTINDPAPKTVPIVFQLYSGQPTMLGYQLTLKGTARATSGALFGTSANILGSATNSFNIDFSHTMSWGGFTSATNVSTGQLIDGWTLTSQSGTDYTQPVPEPATYLDLMVAGAVFMVVRLRRHRVT